ncbi:GntR family transcriptional regulator [Alkalicoccobacillus murimartini]|uniref:DNA-binding GntR family transcriptional regulator n=1 Tax=Alkalicoccobacillus murimartini TaxID=171685 RepID=A0ABT9YHZ8_9BACI|nr:GntR family transcriptional regulator [Alkalicoccobacillus murimartini]MDQ0207309.1 DNA-binding GntR family transcriptional regulator [Alkalicoccobacillus murimartini]
MTKTEFVSDDLLSKIYQNKYQPGEKLPTERDLAEQYQVSRYTIRHAIKKLLNIGCVRVIQGSGIFVTDTKYKSPLIYNSLTEKKFNEIESKIIHLKKVEANPSLEKTFDLKNQELWEYKRIRIVDYQKVQIETSLLPYQLFPDLNEQILAKSVHNYVQQCGYQISHFITTYSAVSVTKEDAALLNCKKGLPAMKIMNRGILSDGRVFEYSELINLDYTVSYFTPFNSHNHQQRLE